MYQRPLSLRARLTSFLLGAPDLRRELLEESTRKNELSALAICAIIFVFEVYNLLRVLLWSRSGLTSSNNRHYFAMYCLLIAIAAVWLLLQWLLRRSGPAVRWAVQYTAVVLILLWHVILNTYDLKKDPAAGTTVLTTALLGLAVLIQMRPLWALLLYGLGYGLFRLLAAAVIPSGDRVNLTITFVVALAVSLLNAHHAAVSLDQRRQITHMNQRLQRLIKLDPLTGLLNKTSMEGRVREELARVGEGGGVTLFIVDLDDFKSINDRCGHPCGDRVLVETAADLRAVFSEAESIGRIGGDEFAVVFGRPLEEAEVQDLAGRLARRLEHIRWKGREVGARCSLGCCVCTDGESPYEGLYEQADRMLYLAKRDGKGRCRVCRTGERAPAR